MTSPWFICGKDIKDDVTSVSCNLVFCSLFCCCCCWRLSCFFCKWYKDKRSCPSKNDVLSDEELQLFSSSIIFSIFSQSVFFLGSNIIYMCEVHYKKWYISSSQYITLVYKLETNRQLLRKTTHSFIMIFL